MLTRSDTRSLASATSLTLALASCAPMGGETSNSATDTDEDPEMTTSTDGDSTTGALTETSGSGDPPDSTGSTGDATGTATTEPTTTGLESETDTTTDAGSFCEQFTRGEIWMGEVMIESDEDVGQVEGIECIEGNLNIRGTTSTLLGMEALVAVRGRVSIAFAPLVNLSGLDGLTIVDGKFSVTHTPALETLEGLESLTAVYGRVEIHSNDQLTSLLGLGSLEEAHHLDIGILAGDGNPLLAELPLTKLESLVSLTIVWNSLLDNLDGFASLGPGSVVDRLEIAGNGSLPTCEAYALAEAIEHPNPLIWSNLPDECGS